MSAQKVTIYITATIAKSALIATVSVLVLLNAMLVFLDGMVGVVIINVRRAVLILYARDGTMSALLAVRLDTTKRIIDANPVQIIVCHVQLKINVHHVKLAIGDNGVIFNVLSVIKPVVTRKKLVITDAIRVTWQH